MADLVDVTRNGQLLIRETLLGADTDYRLARDPYFGGMGTPDLRVNDRPRPQSHGRFTGHAYMDARTLTFTFKVLADSLADARTKALAFGAAWSPTFTDLETAATSPFGFVATALSFRFGDALYTVNGRAGRHDIDTTQLWNGYVMTIVAEFIATDPLFYDAEGQVETVSGALDVTGGLDLPFAFPFAFGTITSSGSAQMSNTGNIDSRAWAAQIVATSTVTNPRIENVDTGEFVAVDITLTAGDVLVIYGHTNTVVLNNTASRTGNIRRPDSTWFAFPPGATTVRLRVDTGTAYMTFTLAAAYIF